MAKKASATLDASEQEELSTGGKKKKKLSPAEFMAAMADKTGEKDGIMVVYGSQAGDAFFKPRYHISTGNRFLDAIIGEGGLGTGRISEFYGPNRTGKSEIAQRTAASFLGQYTDGLCFYFDQELALDEKKLNANPMLKSQRFAVNFAPTIQKMFAKIEKMLRAMAEAKLDVPVLIVIDSIAVMESDAQAKKQITDVQQPGTAAKAISEALRKIKPIIQQTHAHMLIINQTRKQIGADTMGEDESTMGEALKFACDYRVNLQPRGLLWFRAKDKEDKKPSDGFIVEAHTIKNKRVPPNRKVWLAILYHPLRGGLNEAWSCWELFGKKHLDLFGQSGQNYSLRHGPHNTNDLLKFTKAEWQTVFQRDRALVEKVIKKWEDEIMLKTERDVSEDVPEEVVEESEESSEEAAA